MFPTFGPLPHYVCCRDTKPSAAKLIRNFPAVEDSVAGAFCGGAPAVRGRCMRKKPGRVRLSPRWILETKWTGSAPKKLRAPSGLDTTLHFGVILVWCWRGSGRRWRAYRGEVQIGARATGCEASLQGTEPKDPGEDPYRTHGSCCNVTAAVLGESARHCALLDAQACVRETLQFPAAGELIISLTPAGHFLVVCRRVSRGHSQSP